MMSFKKTLAALAATAAMAAAQAAPITVSGVTFDPDSLSDFTGTSARIFQNIDSNGVLSGYGFINTINDTDQNYFAPNGELTFTFTGYAPIPGSVPGAAVTNYTGGSFNVYYDSSRDATGTTAAGVSRLNATTAANGILWLSLAGRPDANGYTLVGLNNRATNGGLSGGGLLDATGGAAFNNLNTNGQVGGADLAFTSSFTTFLNGNIATAFGTANFNGNSIPEPASLALVGLGLLGVAAARRKASKK